MVTLWNFRQALTKTKGGGNFRGGGKHTLKTPSQNGSGVWNPRPPPYDTFPPPPVVHALSPSLEDTRRIPLSEASKAGLGGDTLQYVFPPKSDVISQQGGKRRFPELVFESVFNQKALLGRVRVKFAQNVRAGVSQSSFFADLHF